jgi:mono/diheme cytochrome c family protein
MEQAGRPPRVLSADDGVGLGERLYRQGVSASGSAVTAIVQGDLRIRGTDMTCVNCHRRSGWGTAEGPVRVPPIVGSVLFAPVTQGHPEMGPPRTTGPGTRPAYTDTTLLRALRDGVDPAGRTLSPSMPRYTLDDEDGAALATYLRSLSAVPAPGVDDTSVHLATILTPGVSAGRRASMLDVLRTYVRHKNAGTRNETGRRERGPWDMKRHYENYRTWVLYEWNVQGSPREWPAQLAELYRRQPVFAFVSGLAEDDWTPIHAFSERLNVPTVLPQTPLPPATGSGEGFYSLYFSRGITLEAETLAHHLETSARAPRVVQVSRCGGAGQAAAAVLARRAAPSATIRSQCLDPEAALTGAVWRGLLQGQADTLVLWLGPGDLPGLETLAAEPSSLAEVEEIYVSSSLLDEQWDRLPKALAARALLLHPFVPPDEFGRHAARALTWMKANRIAAADPQVAVNALFAAMLAADALSHPRALVSREYFLERMEHMAARSPNRSAYPAVSFGPQRRFGSSGCQVLKVPAVTGEVFRKVGAWYVPTP